MTWMSTMMVMREPRGFLITWTCYGTWLHGDERASVDNGHNAYGAPHLPTNSTRYRNARQRMQHAPYLLGETARRIATDTIEAHCRVRSWQLLAVNVPGATTSMSWSDSPGSLPRT